MALYDFYLPEIQTRGVLPYLDILILAVVILGLNLRMPLSKEEYNTFDLNDVARIWIRFVDYNSINSKPMHKGTRLPDLIALSWASLSSTKERLLFLPNKNVSSQRLIIHSLLLQSHLLLDLGDGVTWVETLGARPCAIENRMASVQAHRVVKGVLSLGLSLVTRIDDPSVRLQEDGGTKVLLGVPPVRRARGRAAGAENALVETIQLPPVLLTLTVFLSLFNLLVWTSFISSRCRGL